MRKLVIAAVVALATAVLAPAALAAPAATPFGGATVEDGNLKLVSNTGDASATNDASGATFTDVGVTTFASLATLSTEFNVTDDDCGGGSPRFELNVQTASGAKNVWAYLGPLPNFTGCTPNTWLSSGNLVGTADVRWDTSQVVSGSQRVTYAQALENIGGATVVNSVKIVVDSGWFFQDKEQTVLIRNLRVNGALFFQPQVSSPAAMNPAKACAKLRGMIGPASFTLMWGAHANAFGKCVSYMAHLKHGAARAAAVTSLSTAAKQCVAVHGKAKGKSRGKGKAKAKIKLAVCLRQTH